MISGSMGEKDDIIGSLVSPVYSNSKYVISVNNQGTTTTHSVYMDSVLTTKWQNFIVNFSHYITLCKSLLLCSQCYMFLMKSFNSPYHHHQ